jgi:hypothetical protein
MFGQPWRSKLLPQRAFRHFRDHAFARMCHQSFAYA